MIYPSIDNLLNIVDTKYKLVFNFMPRKSICNGQLDFIILN